MSHLSSSSSFQSLFSAALQQYADQTGTKLDDHPIEKQLKDCYSLDSISSVLQEHAQRFAKSQGDNGRIMKCLNRTIYVLYTLSTSTGLGEGTALVRPTSLFSFIVPHVYLKAVPTSKGRVCRFRNLACRTSVSSFMRKYPCEASVNQATKDVSTSYNALIDLLESIENFLGRLDIYTNIPLTAAMTDIVIKLLIEILSTLALATKQAKQGRLSEPCFR